MKGRNHGNTVVFRPIEFAEKEKNYIYIVGIGHIVEHSFPYTWDLSQTAPMVSGVIALMKEINPQLRLSEIKDILLQSGRSIKAGFKVLDACVAVKNAKI